MVGTHAGCMLTRRVARLDGSGPREDTHRGVLPHSLTTLDRGVWSDSWHRVEPRAVLRVVILWDATPQRAATPTTRVVALGPARARVLAVPTRSAVRSWARPARRNLGALPRPLSSARAAPQIPRPARYALLPERQGRARVVCARIIRFRAASALMGQTRRAVREHVVPSLPTMSAARQRARIRHCQADRPARVQRRR